ncbi:hypothetical protein BC939DRAFT_466550 [Gamsiella multidivaricata]|uniref:uncharacterized protein n=1 Tax=Gamsiella multidivaricata TaxID=101098 RepID=UPI00221FE671|nr:uncharacterized protein BC939DRAFT_466550 [Gamsiella multidivaricata]KAI7817255.1 hypothetical protein BC939DRAFT_466550 [Gamsiella multidivaricata]
MSGKQRTLYVAGFSQRSRPKDIAYEFERFGRLVRCDVPALRNNSSRPYAFIEYEDERDARDAYNEMRDARFEGHRLNVQFAKNTPSSSWRYEREGGHDRSRSPRRARSPARRRSPRRRSPSPTPRRRSASPRHGSSGSTPSRRRSVSPRNHSPRPENRGRTSASRSPVRERSKEREGDRSDNGHERASRSPDHGKESHGKDSHDQDNIGDRSRSPSPNRRSSSPQDHAMTP